MVSPRVARSVASRASRRDRIVVVGGAIDTVDLLRLATVRSDDVALFVPALDPALRRFVQHFAVQVRLCKPSDQDLAGASAILLSSTCEETTRIVLAAAHRFEIPLHASQQPMLSDFTLIEMLERHPSSFAEDDCA
jgi:hypothetical protein